MSTKKWLDIVPNVVTRLRLSFAIIAAVLVLAQIYSVKQFRDLTKAVNNLTASTFSVFVKTEETERGLKNLVLLLQQADTADRITDLTPIADNLRGGIDLLRLEISSLSGTTSDPALIQEMAASLVQIEESTELFLAAKTTVLRETVTLRDVEEKIESARDSIHEILEELSLETKILSVPASDGSAESFGASISAIERYFSQEILRSAEISAMTLDIETVTDKAIGLKAQVSLQDVDSISDSMRFKLRSLTTLLAQIKSQEQRVAMAKNVIELRELIFGNDGIVSITQSLLVGNQDLENHIESQIAPVTRISALANQLTAQTRLALENANKDVDRSVNQLVLTLGLATLSGLIAIAATSYFVVELQISMRMSKLTRAVLSIADGKTDYVVDVSGKDEIGKMAGSLQVFKSNADELVRSNEELQRFAFIAAHDLRSPLRAIQDLTAWIASDEENRFSDESAEYIALLDTRVERLNRLLTDLLEYSRVGNEANAYAPVQLASAVDDIGKMLDPDNNFSVKFSGDLETVSTVAIPLRQIMQNLINNSIKHHDKHDGNITVTAYIDGQRLHCAVADDGPGIDPRYHDKVFGLFQTLRPRDEIEGSGMGLAIVNKLIDRYQGKIYVVSDPEAGRGTRIHFDLPIELIS